MGISNDPFIHPSSAPLPPLSRPAAKIGQAESSVDKKIEGVASGSFQERAKESSPSPSIRADLIHEITHEITPEAALFFWEQVAAKLAAHPNQVSIEIEGRGPFSRQELALLVELKPQVSLQKLEPFVHRLRAVHFFEKNYPKKTWNPLILHAISAQKKEVAEDLAANVAGSADDAKGTALQWAVTLDHTEVAELLLASCTEAHLADLLTMAILGGDTKMVKFLLAKGAKADLPDAKGVTPLMLAIQERHFPKRHFPIVEALIDGSDLNAVDALGQPALTKAAWTGQSEIVELLLKNGADPNLADLSLLTPLMHAAIHGHLSVFKLLLEKGADTQAVDGEGKSLLYLLKALRTPHWKVMRQLIKAQTLHTPEISNYAKQYKQLKLLALAFAVKGKSLIQEREVDWEGGARELSAATMAKSIKQFSALFPHLWTESVSQQLTESLEFAADHRNYTSEQVLERARRGLPTFVLTGYTGHAVTVLLLGDRLILCNRGESSQRPLEVYHFDPDKLTKETLQLLMKTHATADDYKAALHTDVPEALDFIQTKDDKKKEHKAAVRDQTVGNCSWAATEGAIKAYLLLEQESDIPFETTFNNWLLFQQLTLLEKYIDHSPDPELISESFAALWALQFDSSHSLESSLTQQIDFLEEKYLSRLSAPLRKQFSENKIAKQNMLKNRE